MSAATTVVSPVFTHPDRDVRQRQLVPPQRLARCHAVVVGVGAVGRQVALQLAAVGVASMDLLDDDRVAVENLAPQAYFPDELGQTKVEATALLCRRLNPDAVVTAVPERFRRSTLKTLPCLGASADDRRVVLFACVDSMAGRRLVWQTARPRLAFFADARMAAEVVRVLASGMPAADAFYATTLFGDGEAYAGACTARSTIYAATVAAGLMLAQFTRWLRDLPLDRDQTLNLLASELTVA